MTDRDDQRLYRGVRRRILSVFVPMAIVLGIGWGWALDSVGMGLLVGVAALVAVFLGVWLMQSMPPFKKIDRS